MGIVNKEEEEAMLERMCSELMTIGSLSPGLEVAALMTKVRIIVAVFLPGLSTFLGEVVAKNPQHSVIGVLSPGSDVMAFSLGLEVAAKAVDKSAVFSFSIWNQNRLEEVEILAF
jgi:hypothetical protein